MHVFEKWFLPVLSWTVRSNGIQRGCWFCRITYRSWLSFRIKSKKKKLWIISLCLKQDWIQHLPPLVRKMDWRPAPNSDWTPRTLFGTSFSTSGPSRRQISNKWLLRTWLLSEACNKMEKKVLWLEIINMLIIYRGRIMRKYYIEFFFFSLAIQP